MPRNIDLALNYPVLPGQEMEMQKLLKSAFKKLDNFASLAPAGGSLYDRQIAAGWLSLPGYIIDPADVYLASGGHHGILACILTVGLQNKKVVVEEFTYSNFKSIAKLFGITLIPCAVDIDGLKASSISEICLKNQPDALFIMPTLNNPLGTVMPLARRLEIVAVARKNNMLIIEDDPYGFLEENPPPNFFHLAPDRSFYIHSFSKSFARAIKTSYLLAPRQFSENIADVLRLSASSPSPLFSLALNDFITSGGLKLLIKKKQKEGAFRQQKARELLNDYELTGHKNSWHLWVKLPPGIKSDELSKRLKKAGVGIVPSTSFSATENLYDQAIRIAFGGEIDFNRVIEGIEVIKGQITSY